MVQKVEVMQSLAISEDCTESSSLNCVCKFVRVCVCAITHIHTFTVRRCTTCDHVVKENL